MSVKTLVLHRRFYYQIQEAWELKDKRSVYKDTPEGTLAEAIVSGSGSDVILRQEASGQASLVNSDVLPTEIRFARDYDPKAVLEGWGVKLLDIVENDPLFCYVELPTGWKKESTDHSMWSHLVDNKGRIRARIFYKAAFYDRSAHMCLERRFAYSFDYEKEHTEGVAVASVTDGGKTLIFTTDPVKLSSRDEDCMSNEEAKQLVKNTAKVWLDEHYPDWVKPDTYWD